MLTIKRDMARVERHLEASHRRKLGSFVLRDQGETTIDTAPGRFTTRDNDVRVHRSVVVHKFPPPPLLPLLVPVHTVCTRIRVPVSVYFNQYPVDTATTAHKS